MGKVVLPASVIALFGRRDVQKNMFDLLEKVNVVHITLCKLFFINHIISFLCWHFVSYCQVFWQDHSLICRKRITCYLLLQWTHLSVNLLWPSPHNSNNNQFSVALGSFPSYLIIMLPSCYYIMLLSYYPTILPSCNHIILVSYYHSQGTNRLWLWKWYYFHCIAMLYIYAQLVLAFW